jgi:hypothetical protein
MSAKALWIRMLTEGGRWKAKELADVGGENYGRALTAMYQVGSVKRFAFGVYGVTLDCKIPVGVTLAELVQAGAIKETA